MDGWLLLPEHLEAIVRVRRGIATQSPVNLVVRDGASLVATRFAFDYGWYPDDNSFFRDARRAVGERRRGFQGSTYPVILGTGKRLFGDPGERKTLRLVHSKVIGDGVVILTYASAPPDRRLGLGEHPDAVGAGRPREEQVQRLSRPGVLYCSRDVHRRLLL